MVRSYESRYSVHPEHIPTLPEYKNAVHSMSMSGGHSYHNEEGLRAVCYCPYLIVLFRQRQLPVKDAIKQQDTIIDGGVYYEPFIKGFAAGLTYFDNQFTVPPAVLYSSPEYLSTINRLYYGDGSKLPDKHCLQMRRRCPITLEHSQFHEIGYWSGITFRIESLMSLHHGLFTKATEPSIVQPVATELAEVEAKSVSSKKTQVNTFEELFKDYPDSKCFDQSLTVLRDLDPPAISANKDWITDRRGNHPAVSIVIAWVTTLEERGIITKLKDRHHLVKLLKNCFPGLVMAVKSEMWTTESAAKSLYHTRFMSKIRPVSRH